MRGVLLIPESGAHLTELLGMPVGQRALFAAADAGAAHIEVDRFRDAGVQSWSRDGRNGTRLAPYTGEGGDALVLSADAIVAPALLAELAQGEAIDTDSGARVAARVLLRPGEPASVALRAARPRAWRSDRYRYAVRCDAARSRLRAERALLEALVKPSDGPVSRYLNRPISTAISRLLVPLGVSADHMTVASGLVALVAALCAAGGTFAMQATGAVLLQAHSILDGCDGEIARLTRRSTARGALLDSLVDDASNLLFFGALSYGVATSSSQQWPMLAGAVTVFAYLGVIAVQYAVVLRATGSGDKARFWRADGKPRNRLHAIVHEMLRRNVFIALILVAVVAGFAHAAVAVLPVAAIGALWSSARRALAADAAETEAGAGLRRV